ncbi:MAG: hypothetical protein HC880_11470 [Bacteroidia bacterium]|nr:hypothetical protein [Bacteroidia bacterium]
MDNQAKLILVNEQSKIITGLTFSPHEVLNWMHNINLSYPDKVTPLPPDQFPLHRALRGERNANVEVYIKTRGSLGKFLSVTGSPLEDAQKNIIGSVIIFRNITEEKQREQEISQLNGQLENLVRERTAQLEETNRELETFNYSISHDLRAPIRAIAGNIFFLKESYQQLLDEDALHLLDNINSGAIRMGQLVDDLLAFSRVGKTELNKIKVDLYHIADEVFSELFSPSRNRQVYFHLHKIPAVYADANAMRLVMLNLLSNSLKYTSRKAKAVIEVGSFEKESKQIYYVKDDGVGFNPEYADKIFEVFQRAHLRKEFEGNGVGLAIVKRVIEKHGGSIWAEAAEEQGATFFFSLPE